MSGEKDRDIILQHLGSDSKKGWYAFLAAPAEQAACLHLGVAEGRDAGSGRSVIIDSPPPPTEPG